MGSRCRVLVIDDRAPRAAAGSGFPRTVELLRDLAARPGLDVAILPTIFADTAAEAATAELGVAVLSGGFEDQIAGFDPDLVVASRPHNASRAIPVVRERCPRALVVADIEALFHRRMRLEAALEDDPSRRDQLLEEASRVEGMERAIARDADLVVCLSVDERDWLLGIDGCAPVAFVPPWSSDIELQPPAWDDRHGALFVAGWSAGVESPNGDGLTWMDDHVLPRLAELAPELAVDVTGADPPAPLLGRARPSLRFVGAVDDLEGAYCRARVAVAPVRYGAGVKLKVMEALQAGTPVVTTSVGAEGFTTELRDAIVVRDDADAFADAAATLAVDRRSWFEQRLRIEVARVRTLAAGVTTVAEAITPLLDRAVAGAGR